MRFSPAQTRIGMLFLSAVLYGMLSPSGHAQVSFPVFPQSIQGWYELPPEEKSRALKNYRRFQQLPPDRQRDIKEQYNRFQQLPPEEKARIRRNYERYEKMDEKQREDFERRFEKYKKGRSRPPR